MCVKLFQSVVLNQLAEILKNNMEATGIIIEGYPRTTSQADDYDKYVSKLSLLTLHL